MLLSLIALLGTFILVIGIHELGHILAALHFQVRMLSIGLGFGKPIVRFTTRHGLQWIIGALPLGGYVRLCNTRIGPVSKENLNYAFDQKPLWVQAVILIAGCLMNFLCALFALMFFFLLGFMRTVPAVQSVNPASIMAKAGLEAGDRLAQIDQNPIKTWADAGMILAIKTGQKNIALDVENPKTGSRTLHVDLDNIAWSTKKNFLEQFGIVIDKGKQYEQKIPGESLTKAVMLSFKKIGDLVVFFLILIKQIVTAKLPFSILLGPIGLLSLSVHSFLQGLAIFLYFIATLNVAVGLVNLFPLPGLDGGALVYLLIEKIRGKPLSVAVEVLAYRLAMIAFFVFLVQLILNDLHHWGNQF